MAERKALMMCYHYPPVSTAGTWRSLAFSRHLPEFSWAPTVLSVKTREGAAPDLPGVVVRRAARLNLVPLANKLQGAAGRFMKLFKRDLQKLYVKDLILFPDAEAWWFSMLPGLMLARSHDLLYVSCSPFSAAIRGCLIKTLTGVPLILDFRDPWDLDLPSYHPRFYLSSVRRLERAVVSRCDALIVTSEGAKELYVARYPEISGKVICIPNGYDALSPAPPAPAGRKPFSIVHVGAFYGERSSRPILEALHRLGNPEIEFVQLGNRDRGISEYEGKVRMRVLSAVPRPEAIAMQQSASLLYLRQSLKNNIAIAGKTLEYLATGLPILAHCPAGDNSEILRRYGKYVRFCHSDDPDGLMQAITAAVAADECTRPEISPQFVHDLDRKRLTGKLAEVFDRVAAARPRRG